MGSHHALDRDFAPPAESCLLWVGPDGWRCVTCATPWSMSLRLRGWRQQHGTPEELAVQHAREVHHDAGPRVRHVAREGAV